MMRMRRSVSRAAVCAGVVLVSGLFAASGVARAQDTGSARQEMIELGLRNATARELYDTLREQAGDLRPLSWDDLPDWSGIYTRARGGISYDPDAPRGGGTNAKLTPQYEARWRSRIELARDGIQWDPIGTCAPPGHPRWLTEPFLREFIVTPDQTWLINEMVNDIRRVYTDGRSHPPEEERYPLYNGDSIGFWDGDRLVIHTNQLRAGIYQRSEPDYTDAVETVEIWQKADDGTLEVDVWVYDPPALEEPWYTKQSYARLSNQDTSLRIRYWHCGENQNNAVFQTEEGATDFIDFTFTEEDDR